MKKAIFLFIAICLYAMAHAQDKKPDISGMAPVACDTLLPYQKFPTLPAFNIREMDSITIFNTYNIPDGRPVALMLFMPDCKHCQRTMDALIRGMDSIKNIRFYLVTAVHSMKAIKEFYNEHHLERYKNIEVVGMDYEFFYFSYYNTRFVPDIALYDEHKKLVHLIEGETNAGEVYKWIH